MGVLGLWQVLESVGHPIKLEGLEGKRLGVDANVWLYKFIRGFREKDNATSIDSHKLGLFNRISKLLFYKIKPVFVFDGPAPVLKRRTLERRQNIRNKQLAKVQDAAMRLFAEQLREQYPDANLDDITIQLPELRSNSLVAAEKLTDEDRDLFYLPPEEVKIDESEDDASSGSEDVKPTSQSMKQENLVYHVDDSDDDLLVPESDAPIDIESKDFEELPAEVRYEILTDIRESRRKIRRRHALPDDAGTFSNFQLERLKAKRRIQEKIEKCEKDICSMYTGEMGGQTIQSYRVQSDATSTMLYMQATPKIEKSLGSQESEVASQSTTQSTQAYSMEPEVDSQSRVNKEALKPLFDTPSQPVAGTINIRAGKRESLKANLGREFVKSPSFSESSGSETEIEQQIDEEEKSLQKLNESQKSDATILDEPIINEDKLEDDLSGVVKEDEMKTATPKSQSSESNESDSDLEEVPIPKHSQIENSHIKMTDSLVETSPLRHETILIESSPAQTPSQQRTILLDTTHVESPELLVGAKEQASEQDIIHITSDSPTADEGVIKLDDVEAQDNVIEGEEKEEETKSNSEAVKERSNVIVNEANLDKFKDIRSEQTRVTNKVTTKIVEEAKELLRLFGIPYIDAAGEAEAQCAKLEELKLIEGTITDDSDVWLFGSQNVYRYFFSDDKYVMHYKMTDIEYHIRMNRENLVCFAMLVGSDYTDGIMNVGPVTALEILSEFQGEGLEPLIKFRNWRDKYSKSKDRVPGSKKRESFLKFKLPEEFPSRAVFEGYLQPMADTSTEQFSWGTPELDELREYARRNFGWDIKKIDDKLLPVMKKLSERKTQSTIDTYFFKTAANQNPELFRSKRVNEALNKIAKTADWEEEADDEVVLTEDEDADGAGTSKGKQKQAKRGTSAKQKDLKNKNKKQGPTRSTAIKRRKGR